VGDPEGVAIGRTFLMSAAINVEHVSKKFILPQERKRPAAQTWLERFRQRRGWKEEFWALQDVSFALAPNESLGLMGINGSGKSTILKLIVNILHPTSGSVRTHGRIAALLELGAGFHPDLSGRDNVYLNGSVLGINRREIARIFDEIVDFAELEQFIDVPVKYYSSGMYLRLGFSIAVHVKPDILIIDETLAVGDQAFQAKCLARIRDVKKQGVTLVLVSHSLEDIRDQCQRGIWLQDGRVRADGPVDTVVREYLGAVVRKEAQDMREAEAASEPSPTEHNEKRWGSGDVEITDVEFLNGHNLSTNEFKTGDNFTARIHYSAHKTIMRPNFGVAIYDANGVQINGPNTELSEQQIDYIDGIGSVDYTITALPLLSGNYLFSAAVYDREGIHAYDHHHATYQFTVLPGGAKERYGIFNIPSDWTHQRSNGLH
jgi:ABC-type polysaccharide/polyol phosphate transport system ATPase subunit